MSDDLAGASPVERGVRRLVVARFPIPRKAPAVVMMPADMSTADMDMLTGMVSLLGARFKLPSVPLLGHTGPLRDGAEGCPVALRPDDCAGGSIPQGGATTMTLAERIDQLVQQWRALRRCFVAATRSSRDGRSGTALRRS